MRLPNGYGSVINLGKKRRKPFAARITDGTRINKKGIEVQTYKYLQYFEKSKDAYGFLARYNAGEPIKEHIALINQPTFEEIYTEWYEYKHNLNKKPSESTSQSYRYGFNMCESLHKRKFNTLKVDDLQSVVDQYKGFSKGVVGNIRTIYFALYEYAIKHEIVEKNYSKMVDYEYSEERRIEHINFKTEEIEFLWKHLDIEYVDWVLIMIYMGWRVSEFCDLENKNIHLDSRYIIGGGKTESGKNRTVPIHNKIVPLIQKYYNPEKQYLLSSKNTDKMNYKSFLLYWSELMKVLDMKHTPHDTRYTTATLLDNAGANKVSIQKIMGHKSSDITEGIYIQKDLIELLKAIDLIKL